MEATAGSLDDYEMPDMPELSDWDETETPFRDGVVTPLQPEPVDTN